jgi:hypothetical protein
MCAVQCSAVQCSAVQCNSQPLGLAAESQSRVSRPSLMEESRGPKVSLMVVWYEEYKECKEYKEYKKTCSVTYHCDLAGNFWWTEQ